jgi:hypothetical protein
VRRAPLWALLAAVLLFPIGLILLLLIDEKSDLQLVVRPAPDGSEVLVVGKTRQSVVDTLREAFRGLLDAQATTEVPR